MPVLVLNLRPTQPQSLRIRECQSVSSAAIRNVNTLLHSNITELSQITPATACFYSFYTPSATPNEGVKLSDAKPLGPTAALQELHARGCSLATHEWIDNHWPLILWKLAGMVALEPEAESDPDRKRWCWPEVIRQLLYRFVLSTYPFHPDQPLAQIRTRLERVDTTTTSTDYYKRCACCIPDGALRVKCDLVTSWSD